MFPSDNGVFIKKLLENGIFNTTVSYVRKNDLVFGIKKNEENLNEFWLNFPDGLKLSVIFKDSYTGLFNNNENPIDMNSGSISSLTLPDGLFIQILPAGEICMKHYKNSTQNLNYNFSSSEEQYRIISSKATVIRNFPLETKIEYCTGNTCSIVSNLATNTNNKGFRLARNINDENDINENESILITKNFEKDTNTHSIVKQDNVLIIDYPDKSKYVIHSDNTKIYTSPTYKEVTHYIIENDNYPSVEIIYDQVKKRTQTCIAAGSTEALMGSDNLMTRSYDGRLSKIVLPNNTLVYTYKEKKATEEFNIYSYNTVTLISRNDGTIIRINQDGDIVIITSNERKRLNDLGMKKNFDDLLDVDYLFELNGKNSERKGGIYTCDLAKGKIWTRDDETNIFEIHSNGIAKCKIEGTTIPEMNEKNIDDIEPNSPRYKEDFYIHPEVRFSEVPKNFFPPRLFAIDNKTNDVIEYLNEEQVENFKRNMQKDKNHVNLSVKNNNDGSKSYIWFEKKVDSKSRYKEIQVLDKIIKLPQKYQPLTQAKIIPIYPEKNIFICRKSKDTGFITDDIRKIIEEGEEEAKDNFNKTYIVRKKDIVDKKIILMNRDIQRRFIQERMEKNEEDENQE